MFLSQGPITMSVIVIVIILQVLLFRSRWGLRTRAVGEHPRAADTVGVNVIALRYRNVILGGIFAGLAGAWLTLEFNASFQNGITANRGFIALAAVIFGRWTPIGAFGGALLFMFSEALGIAIRSNPRLVTSSVAVRHPGELRASTTTPSAHRTSSRSSSSRASSGAAWPRRRSASHT